MVVEPAGDRTDRARLGTAQSGTRRIRLRAYQSGFSKARTSARHHAFAALTPAGAARSLAHACTSTGGAERLAARSGTPSSRCVVCLNLVAAVGAVAPQGAADGRAAVGASRAPQPHQTAAAARSNGPRHGSGRSSATGAYRWLMDSGGPRSPAWPWTRRWGGSSWKPCGRAPLRAQHGRRSPLLASGSLPASRAWSRRCAWWPGSTEPTSGCRWTLVEGQRRPSSWWPASNGTVAAYVLERETGFEPATSTLARSRSTAELFPRTRPALAGSGCLARARRAATGSRLGAPARAVKSPAALPRGPGAADEDVGLSIHLNRLADGGVRLDLHVDRLGDSALHQRERVRPGREFDRVGCHP